MINVDSFLQTIPVMLYGMGGIFIVILTIIFCVLLLNFLFPGKQ